MLDGTSPSGSPKTKPSTIYTGLLCTTQTDENKLVMPQAGQTVIDYRVMYCGLIDVKGKDVVEIVTAPSNANVGNKYLVVQVNDYSTDYMEHMEVSLEGGVV